MSQSGQGPAKTYSAARTFLQSGKYEIVEEKNGFGKLKSGVGWVYLKESGEGIELNDNMAEQTNWHIWK